MSTAVCVAIKEAADHLARAGIESPRREARLLIGHVLDCALEALLLDPEKTLNEEQAQQLSALVSERARRRPLSHLLGHREFWSLSFKVSADTLDPRADSETLIQAVLETFGADDKPLRILDLGTGSGCLLLTLLKELPQAEGVGVDISGPALEVARENAVALGLEKRAVFLMGSWGEPLSREKQGCFDIIISNPPYIPDGQIDGLQPEVALYEPRGALAGGVDGLDCYRALAPYGQRLLSPDGALFLELGEGQSQGVMEILENCGFRTFSLSPDLAGISRCLKACF